MTDFAFPTIRVFLLLCICCGAAAADDFPEIYNTEPNAGGGPTPAREAAETMQLPAGFHASVFASEPYVENPIAMTWDGRGRLWIAENFTYADAALHFDLGLRDRVLIFEDTDGDGRFDNRTVFTDDVQMLTSIEVGHGGLWLMCPPRVLFIPDRDRDDVPDGPAEARLDGFTVATDSYHNFANGLRWGPDGWLYGRCGHSCPGLIGPPGTPPERRHHLAGGMWRYHPTRNVVEVLTAGTTNPWGHDWNEYAQGFFVNTVNGHLWHLIPGAHFNCGSTLDPNRRTYELIDQHADHFHFDTGKGWAASRAGAANDLGGGHAHEGAMVYLGDNWPEEYRGRLFTINFHGRRANQEVLERSGSGYVAHHAPDFFLSADPWFRGIDLSYGPDGAVYVIDWSDVGECHERDGIHRTSGRIFRIAYGDTAARSQAADVATLSQKELAALHSEPNEWYVRQARRLLGERHSAGDDLSEAKRLLLQMFGEQPGTVAKLRALCSLSTMEAVDGPFLREQLSHPDEHVRAWAVRTLSDRWPLDDPLGPVAQTEEVTLQTASEVREWRDDLTRLAANDPSGLVRLTLASTLQRLPVDDRAELASALVARSEDAGDHNLPLLVWYGLIPVADADPASLVTVAEQCRWPTTLRLIARRLSEDIEAHPHPINDLLAWAAGTDAGTQRDVLDGLSEALKGWRKAPRPAAWDGLVARLQQAGTTELQERARQLSVLFGDGRALDDVRRIALDRSAPMDERRSALQTLIDARPDNLRATCERLLSERYLNTTAAQGLALFDDPEIGERIVNAYQKFWAPERPQIISLLVSRPSFARALLHAIEKGRIPRDHLMAYHVRQIHTFGDKELSEYVTAVWGALRESPEEKRRLIEQLRTELSPDVLESADMSQGRVVFQTLCAKCHRLYGEGATIGPDLTGANRNSLDYLIENVVDPSAVVNRDFRMTVLALKDGRILNGVVLEETDRTLTLQSPTEKVTVEKDQIEERKLTELSPMPEGQLEMLSPEQVRNLFAYLHHPSQVPLPAVE
jgi:putative membrane-bound dehydrogenase-like protein